MSKNKKNIITVRIIVPNEIVLNRINSTPALSKLSRVQLKVGSNLEYVNHFQYSEQMRMFPVCGCKIEKI